jgi:adenosylcobinamide amidohydrolase
MENVSIKAQSYKSITVTAVVTGGVETNGGRVGDPAPWDELEQKSIPEPGTINIMLFINTNLTDGALARSLVTCTEAKTAALQELAAPSRYSMGLATGSGTDGTIIVCNSESEILLDDAGKHCKLGECIGRSVKAAVTEALALQTGLSAASQHDALKRVSRFGITAESIWQELGFSEPSGIYKAKYSQVLERLFAKPILVTSCSLYAHLLDEAVWGLISEEDAHISGKCLIGHMGVDEVSSSGGKHSSIALMTSELQKALCELVRRELDSIPL